MMPWSFQNFHLLLTAMVAGAPKAPAPKVTPYRQGKHAKGRRPARNAATLRKSRQQMSKSSRRRNRGAA